MKINNKKIIDNRVITSKTWTNFKEKHNLEEEIVYYIEERFFGQIIYYEIKNLKWKKIDFWMSSSTIFLSIAIIILGIVAAILSTENLVARILISCSTGITSVIAAISGYNLSSKAKELKVIYRSTCESLISEFNLFLTKSGPYENAYINSREKAFVARCESILNHEQNNWKEINERVKKKGENNAK